MVCLWCRTVLAAIANRLCLDLWLRSTLPQNGRTSRAKLGRIFIELPSRTVLAPLRRGCLLPKFVFTTRATCKFWWGGTARMLAAAKCRLMAILRSEFQPDRLPRSGVFSAPSRRQLLANAAIAASLVSA